MLDSQRFGDRREDGPKGRVHQHRTTSRLADEVFELATLQRIVDGYMDQSGAGTGQKPDEVGVGVGAVRRDPITSAQADRPEVSRGPADSGIEIAIGPRAIGEPECDPIREFGRAPPEDAVDGTGTKHCAHGNKLYRKSKYLDRISVVRSWAP